jgi:hypothetical protein
LLLWRGCLLCLFTSGEWRMGNARQELRRKEQDNKVLSGINHLGQRIPFSSCLFSSDPNKTS